MRPKHYKTARCILYHRQSYLLADHRGSSRSATRRRRNKARAQGKTRWGLPGGHVEWREAADDAARREVYEELNVELGALHKVGDYVYKQRLHAVFAAPCDIHSFDLDFSELAAVRWFSLREIAALKQSDQLHAGYEYEAVLALASQLETNPTTR